MSNVDACKCGEVKTSAAGASTSIDSSKNVTAPPNFWRDEPLLARTKSQCGIIFPLGSLQPVFALERVYKQEEEGTDIRHKQYRTISYLTFPHDAHRHHNNHAAQRRHADLRAAAGVAPSRDNWRVLIFHPPTLSTSDSHRSKLAIFRAVLKARAVHAHRHHPHHQQTLLSPCPLRTKPATIRLHRCHPRCQRRYSRRCQGRCLGSRLTAPRLEYLLPAAQDSAAVAGGFQRRHEPRDRNRRGGHLGHGRGGQRDERDTIGSCVDVGAGDARVHRIGMAGWTELGECLVLSGQEQVQGAYDGGKFYFPRALYVYVEDKSLTVVVMV